MKCDLSVEIEEGRGGGVVYNLRAYFDENLNWMNILA